MATRIQEQKFLKAMSALPRKRTMRDYKVAIIKLAADHLKLDLSPRVGGKIQKAIRNRGK
jgi:hypothetical protein